MTRRWSARTRLIVIGLAFVYAGSAIEIVAAVGDPRVSMWRLGVFLLIVVLSTVIGVSVLRRARSLSATE